MTHTWFRFYNGAVHDPKVQRLPPALFRFWVNILCLTSANSGSLPSPQDIQFSLKLKPSKVSDFIGHLIAAGLIDQCEQYLAIHNWEGRQYKSDSSTERVKRFRNVSKAVSETGPDSEQIQIQSITTTDAVVVAVGFDQFFKEMPRQWNRASAKMAYSKALAVVSEETLLEAAKKYATQAGGFDDQYILPPAKWLADERWSDFVRAAKSAFDSPEEKAFQQRMVEKYYGTS